jgi:hypothetical protein
LLNLVGFIANAVGFSSGSVRELDIDGERRRRPATAHLHLDLVRLHHDVAADQRQDFLAQNAREIGIGTERPLLGQQNHKSVRTRAD